MTDISTVDPASHLGRWIWTDYATTKVKTRHRAQVVAVDRWDRQVVCIVVPESITKLHPGIQLGFVLDDNKLAHWHADNINIPHPDLSRLLSERNRYFCATWVRISVGDGSSMICSHCHSLGYELVDVPLLSST